MNKFINNIKINKLLHLHDFNIPIADEQYPHLIITGKNGSGKTVLLNAISNFLENVRIDENLRFLDYRKSLEYHENRVTNNEKDRLDNESNIANYRNQIDEFLGKVELDFDDIYKIINDYKNGDFVFALYTAYRKPQMSEPRNPTYLMF